MKRRTKQIVLERAYPAPLDTLWWAWTDAAVLRRWWGPKQVTITDCEIDLRLGGALRIVMEAGAGMGNYRGTRWPMTGTFSAIEKYARLRYDARSWTEGDEGATIDHTNDISFARDAETTVVRVTITITDIGPKAKLAAFGMKRGYRSYLDKLDRFLAAP